MLRDRFYNILDNFKKFLNENFFLFVIFFILTSFFILQHVHRLGWDFSAYLINAKYLFFGGNYYEVYRAPLISVFLGFFLFFGKIASYLYIIGVSILFFISSIKLSDSVYENYLFARKIEKSFFRLIFYLCLLSPIVISYGVIEGTELLGLSFFMLFLSAFISKKDYGHYLALAFLSRYNYLIFGIFLFFNKDWKKSLKNLFYFLLIVFPWFIFNRVKWGNFFTSLVDSFYLNVLSRSEIIEPFNFGNLFYAFSYFIIFFLIGLYYLIKSKSFKKKVVLIFSLVMGLFLWEISTIPFKVLRYNFNLSLPIAFFSSLGIIYLIKNYPKIKKYLVIFLIFLFLISVSYFGINSFNKKYSDDVFKEASETIHDLGYGNCRVLSNLWVPVNYYSGNVFYLNNLENSVNRNNIVLLFWNQSTMDDQFEREDIRKFPLLYENEAFVLLGNENLTKENCVKRSRYDFPMHDFPCEIISDRFEIFKLGSITNKLCLLVNKR